MRVTVEIPERVFRAAKTPAEVADDVRRAAAAYWIARGDVAPDAASAITSPADLSGGAAAQSLMALLASMPDAGQDTDFEPPAPT